MRCAPASRLPRSSLLLLVRGGSECVPGSRYCFCCSYAFTATEQEALQRARNVPAVLQGPDPLAIELARPPQQRREPARADLNGLVAEDLTGRDVDRSQRVRALVGVRPEHDHDPRPHPFRSGCRTLGGQGLLRALPRSYQVTPNIPDRRRATQQKQVRPPGPTASKRVSSPPGRDPPHLVGRHRHPESKQQASKRERPAG